MNNHGKAVCKLFRSMSYRHDIYRLFSDFCELAALSLANAVDLAQREGRESRYLEIVKRYSREELALFPRILAEVTLGLEQEATDLLGAVFHELELHNKHAGQFFSPFELCRMMAALTVGDRDELRQLIESKGYVSVSEPACGAGAMVIALAGVIRERGINYQRHLHVTAVDVDTKAAHMAYIQFSLLHIPAVVVVGNSITLEEREHWYTPAHILGGWTRKLSQAGEPGEPAPAQISVVPDETVEPSMEAPAGQGRVLLGVGQLTLF